MIKKVILVIAFFGVVQAQQLQQEKLEKAIAKTDLEEMVYRFYFHAPHITAEKKEAILKFADAAIAARAKEISLKRSWRDQLSLVYGCFWGYQTYKLGKYSYKKLYEPAFLGTDQEWNMFVGGFSAGLATILGLVTLIHTVSGLKLHAAKTRHLDAEKIKVIIAQLKCQ